MHKVKNWTPDQLPSLAGKRYLITGGNSGIGLEAAKILAGAGADIVIACRNPAKADAAVADIDAAGPGSVDSVSLDLSSMDSVRAAAEDVRQRFDSLDGLVNNAGIMQTPQTLTVDGFELQLATSLQSTGPQGILNGVYSVLNRVWAQSAYQGAIPTVLAVAGEEAESGGYYGPVKLMDSLGPVGNARIAGRGRDEKTAAQLWRRSEELVGLAWEL